MKVKFAELHFWMIKEYCEWTIYTGIWDERYMYLIIMQAWNEMKPLSLLALVLALSFQKFLIRFKDFPLEVLFAKWAFPSKKTIPCLMYEIVCSSELAGNFIWFPTALTCTVVYM